MESSVLANKQNSFAPIPLSLPDFVPHNQIHRNSSHAVLWRPWDATNEDAQSERMSDPIACHFLTSPSHTKTDTSGFERQSYAISPQPNATTVSPRTVMVGGKCQLFQHPVRLFWPKSKSFDYLYSDGEALLRNFPVQATISFYDESDSEDEEEEDDQWDIDGSEDSGDFLKPQSHFTSYN